MSAVVGGVGQRASGSHAAIAGGEYNTASGGWADVGGGAGNVASGQFATVPGGHICNAAGNYSFAAGRQAKANNQGCFVWADATNAELSVSSDNQFAARASGGVYFYTNADKTKGMYLPAGGSSWVPIGFDESVPDSKPVDRKALLDGVARMTVREGTADGVALAAVQALYEELKARDARIDALEAELAKLRK